MTKRKLTDQQSRRIARQQEQRRERAHATHNTNGTEQPGLVVARHARQADVEDTNGDVVRCHLRTNLSDIVTGDRVVWQPSGDESGVIVSVEPSSNRLQRPDSYGKLKSVAANIDQVLVTVAPEPEPHSGLIDRYIVMAENLGITPLILINKCDLLGPEGKCIIRQAIYGYRELHYAVQEISTKSGEGIEHLKTLLQGKTSVFAGQSGVGKSSIIQRLLPSEVIKIGCLSHQAAKGRHTTTHSRLYHFPDGGDCIDSPGIREFGLWHLTAADVIYGFVELRNLAGQCKFRDCRHEQEPGCAINEARHNQLISQERFHSFRRIIQSLDDVEVNPR